MIVRLMTAIIAVIGLIVTFMIAKRIKIKRDVLALLVRSSRCGAQISYFSLKSNAYLGGDPYVPTQGRIQLSIREYGIILVVGSKGVFHPFDHIKSIDVLHSQQPSTSSLSTAKAELMNTPILLIVVEINGIQSKIHFTDKAVKQMGDDLYKTWIGYTSRVKRKK